MEQLEIVAHGVTFETPVLKRSAVFWQIAEPEHARLKPGDQVKCVRYGREMVMRVMKHPKRGVILSPLACDLNELTGERGFDYEAYNSEEITLDRYRLNTLGVVQTKHFSRVVRVVSLSKLGIGFTIPKLCLNFDDIYWLTVMCDDEPVSLRVSVRHAHLQEKNVVYSAGIRSIGPRELELLRYYTASQQLG
jgi:hypothetical protein